MDKNFINFVNVCRFSENNRVIFRYVCTTYRREFMYSARIDSLNDRLLG